MQTCDHNEINIKLGELIGLAEGTNTRLDTINGSLLRHEQDIKDINKWRNRLIGKMSGVGSIIGVIVTITILLLK